MQFEILPSLLTRFVIVGYGHIGRRHAHHIAAHPLAQLLAVCDNADFQLKSAPEKVEKFVDFEQMLAQTEADVICICTPNYLHAQQAVLAMESGFHVVVEKPMALSVRECDAMIAASERTGKKIFAVKQNRYNPPVQYVKNMLREDRLGRVFMLQVNGFWNRNDAYYAQSEWRGKKALDGGCLFTQFSHFIDILYYLNGPVKVVSGRVENYLHHHNTGFEDTGSFVMVAANGAIVNFNFTTGAFQKNMEGSITLFGEKGTIKIGGQYLNTLEHFWVEGCEKPELSQGNSANQYGAYEGSMSNHDAVIDNVIGVLQRGEPLMTSAEEGRSVIEMIEQMYRAAEN